MIVFAYFKGHVTYVISIIVEQDIQHYFGQFGSVVDVAIMRDKVTGKSRGFAFVTFKENSRDAASNLQRRLLNTT